MSCCPLAGQTLRGSQMKVRFLTLCVLIFSFTIINISICHSVLAQRRSEKQGNVFLGVDRLVCLCKSGWRLHLVLSPKDQSKNQMNRDQ